MSEEINISKDIPSNIGENLTAPEGVEKATNDGLSVPANTIETELSRFKIDRNTEYDFNLPSVPMGMDSLEVNDDPKLSHIGYILAPKKDMNDVQDQKDMYSGNTFRNMKMAPISEVLGS